MNVQFLPGTLAAFALFPLFFSIFASKAKAEEAGFYLEDDALTAGLYESSFPTAYESLSEKRVFHQNRIRGMKRNLNDYSTNLHELRRRFRQIFYGRDDGSSSETPFAIGAEVALPEVAPPKRVKYFPPRDESPRPELPSDVLLNPPGFEPADHGGELAFQVDAPGQFIERRANSIPVAERGSRFDYYLFPRIGYSHPAKKHVFSDTMKEYKVGHSIALSTGVRRGPWTLGIDYSHRHNDLKRRSFVITGGSTYHVQNGENNSMALLLQSSYSLPVYSKLYLVLRGGLGGARYKIKATVNNGIMSVAIPPEPNWCFAGLAGGSLSWVFAENVAAHIGLHYYHEDEVPSYNADLGIEFDF